MDDKARELLKKTQVILNQYFLQTGKELSEEIEAYLNPQPEWVPEPGELVSIRFPPHERTADVASVDGGIVVTPQYGGVMELRWVTRIVKENTLVNTGGVIGAEAYYSHRKVRVLQYRSSNIDPETEDDGWIDVPDVGVIYSPADDR